MRSSAPVLCLLAPFAASLPAQYATTFETLNASAAGTIITGQDGFYIPPVGGIDGHVFTYAGNSHGIPTNPNGGSHFFAGRSVLTGTTQTFARAQRAMTLPANGIVSIQLDVLCKCFAPTLQTQNIGSVSLQDSALAVSANLLARWTNLTTFPPATWNADTVIHSATSTAGTQTALADPAFQNLAVDVWHTWGCTIDLNTKTYIDFRITNGVTNLTTIFTPSPPLGLPNQTATALPTDFRFFAGGADNVFAVDNFVLTGAAYTTYGAGCPGSIGVPTLAPAAGSLPRIGATTSVNLGNLPLSLGVMMTGFSDTFGVGQPLPLPLGPFGFPGCDLLADPLVTQFLIGTANTATWSLAIPASTSYVGLTIYQQGLSLDTGSPGASFTNGGRMILGD